MIELKLSILNYGIVLPISNQRILNEKLQYQLK
jgi:hypothetical protein